MPDIRCPDCNKLLMRWKPDEDHRAEAEIRCVRCKMDVWVKGHTAIRKVEVEVRH